MLTGTKTEDFTLEEYINLEFHELSIFKSGSAFYWDSNTSWGVGLDLGIKLSSTFTIKTEVILSVYEDRSNMCRIEGALFLCFGLLCFVLFCFNLNLGRVSYSPGWPIIHFVAKDSHDLLTLLFSLAKDYYITLYPFGSLFLVVHLPQWKTGFVRRWRWFPAVLKLKWGDMGMGPIEGRRDSSPSAPISQTISSMIHCSDFTHLPAW